MSIDLEMEEIHKIFFEESYEGLDLMESSLLNLDERADRETINTIFRAAHSIKGGAATFGFMDVSTFTHGVETLLDEMRNEARPVTSAAVQLLLRSVDVIRSMITAVQNHEPAGGERAAELSTEIEQMLASGPEEATAVAAPVAVPAPIPVVTSTPAMQTAGAVTGVDSAEVPVSEFLRAAGGWIISFVPNADLLKTNNDPLRMFAELERLGKLNVRANTAGVPPIDALEPDNCYLSWTLELAGQVGKHQIEEVFDWVDATSTITYRQVGGPTAPVASVPAPAAAPVVRVAQAAAPQPAKPATASPANAADSASSAPKGGVDAGSIRVATNKLDRLINLVGELVITQSMLSRLADSTTTADLVKLRDGLAQLTRNTRELQESVMQIRMLPISFAFNRFGRLVHDLSRKLGKKVELKLTGENTELDKTVLEKISDPLVHLVRNALDHGLENPQTRLEAGKSETGTIELAAFHEGGSIIIEVKDDGAGLNKARILARARERGLVSPEQELSDDEIHNLIFAAGFSTAEVISDVSGRGVGMDVVRRNIHDLGGNVQIRSVEGRGSTIRIRLPLTLAILDGQLVRVGAESYVISLVAIVETVQASRDRLSVIPGGTELFRLRDEFIPVVRLCDLFGVEPDNRSIEKGLLVVVESEGKRYGLQVDELLVQQQVVIKSLEANFHPVAGVAGATILGDGAVALIIDVPGLVQVFSRRCGAANAA